MHVGCNIEHFPGGPRLCTKARKRGWGEEQSKNRKGGERTLVMALDILRVAGKLSVEENFRIVVTQKTSM